ncbi:MAG: polysaccharide biosynthesis tyrosine autokinase [Rhodothermales bacterium]|nr:polysaccharide biosynthesis tyrosine autokinase [Rhodothermales bacterium]
MDNNSYPVSRGYYQNLPAQQMGPPDPRFMGPMYGRKEPDSKTALHEALEILRLGKWYIIGITALVFIAVTIFTFTMVPVFQASTLLLVDTKAGTNEEKLAPDFLKGGVIDQSKLDTQRLLLQQSTEIARRTADRLVEMRTLPVSGAPLAILEQSTSISHLAQLLQEEYLGIKPADSEGSADALIISASSSSAEEAALIANMYAEEYVHLTEDMSRERLTAQRIFLEQQFAEKKIELDELETRLANYMSREGATALDDQAKYTVAQIATMQAMLEDARIERSMGESQLLTLEQELMDMQPRLTNRVASTVERELEQAQERIADLEMQVDLIFQKNPQLRDNPEGNPTVLDMQAQIAQLRSRVRSLSEEYVDDLVGSGGIDPKKEGLSMTYLADLKRKIADERISISGQQARVRGLEQRLREYDVKLKTIPGTSIELAKLERQQKAAEELYTILSQKLGQIRIAEQSERGFAKVIRSAVAPEAPLKPRKSVNLAMGLMLGLMLGIGAAVARRKLDTRVYTPDDLTVSDINMIGVVPDMRQLIKKEFGKRAKIDFEGREISTGLVALIAPISPIAEAYRRLYIKLQFSRDDRGIQNLMITSPKAGAGKSTTALNLAFTTAQAGRRTLVVDADLRRPSLHDKLGLPEGPSLLELLSEDESRWDSERFFTGFENLYVITGIPVSQPAELLGSRKMIDLVERFRSEFDIVIFDTPPVLGAVDPVLLSRQCDAVIVVASADGTDMDSLKQSIEELRSVGANVIGTVLNRFDPSSMYGYRNTYGYSYGSNSYVAS